MTSTDNRVEEPRTKAPPMSKEQAADLIGLLKGLMPALTREQAKSVGQALIQRSDTEGCRNAIHAYANDYERFSVATFIDRLPSVWNAAEKSWADMDVDRVRREGLHAVRQHAEDDELLLKAKLSDVETAMSAVIAEQDPFIASIWQKKGIAFRPLRSAVAARLRAVKQS